MTQLEKISFHLLHKKKKSTVDFFSSSLEFGNAALRELEDHIAARQPAVDLAIGIQTVVDTATLLLVQDDLEGLGAVLLGADTLADDLDRVDDVGQDGVVDGRQSAGTRALLGQLGAGTRRALRTGQDAAGSNDDDMAVGELLLELTGEAVG
jgi:hypothetical protein